MTVPLDDVAALVAQWRDARNRVGRLAATVDAAETKILALLGDADIGTIGGVPVVCRDTGRRAHFDVLRFRREQPDLAAHYMTTRRRRERLRLARPRHSEQDTPA